MGHDKKVERNVEPESNLLIMNKFTSTTTSQSIGV